MDGAIDAFVEAVIKQGEFLASLAVAIIGGCVALIGWQVTKSSEANVVRLRGMLLTVFCLVLMSLSVLMFYFGYGKIISSFPKLSGVKAGDSVTPEALREAMITAGIGDAQTYFGWQAIFFGCGILVIIAFAVRNYWVIK